MPAKTLNALKTIAKNSLLSLVSLPRLLGLCCTSLARLSFTTFCSRTRTPLLTQLGATSDSPAFLFLAPGAGDAAREHKKKKKRERTEEQAPATGPVGNGATAPIQNSPAAKIKDKKDRKELAVQGGAENRSLALAQPQQEGVKKSPEKGLKGGGTIKTTEKRKDRKEGDGKVKDKKEKEGEKGRADPKDAEDRSLASKAPQRKGMEFAAEKGTPFSEKEGGAEREERPEKKRKKKKEEGGKVENKEGVEKKTEVDRPPKAPAAAEAGGGSPVPVGSPADDAGADVSKREPETGAGVQSGEVGGAEEKPVKRRAKKAGATKEGGDKAKAKKGEEGPAEKGRDEAPFDFWGKYFEGRWQGFWRPAGAPGGSPGALPSSGMKRKGGDEATPEKGGGGNGQQGAGKGGKESKRQKKEAGKATETRLSGGDASEPGEKKTDTEQEEAGERVSKFLIRGPLPCHLEGCRHPARYGRREGKLKLRPDSCSVHKAEGMWEMKTAVCEVAGCAKTARYKYADEKGKSRCGGHKEEGMIN